MRQLPRTLPAAPPPPPPSALQRRLPLQTALALSSHSEHGQDVSKLNTTPLALKECRLHWQTCPIIGAHCSYCQ